MLGDGLGASGDGEGGASQPPAPNLYAPPVETGFPSSTDPDDRIPATGGQRFFGYVIDIIAYVLINVVIGIFIGATGIGLSFVRDPIGRRVFGVVVLVAYYFISESTTSTTLGKMIMGTVVIDQEGQKPSAGAIFGRTLARFIPFEPLSYFFGSDGMWHDTLSSTRVVSREGTLSDRW